MTGALIFDVDGVIADTSSVAAPQLAAADLVVDSLAEVSMESVRKLLTGKSGGSENR